MLREFRDKVGEDRVSLDDLTTWTDGRALGLLLLLIALPETIPLVGFSALLAAPIFVIGAYMLAYGSNPRLPQWLLRRTLSGALVGRVVDRAAPAIRRLDRVCKPRLPLLAGAGRLHGVVSMLMAILLAAPIPGVNMLAAFAVASIGIAILQRDGLLVALSLVFAVLALIGTLGVVTGAFLLWDLVFG
jgi:hypothetical protein